MVDCEIDVDSKKGSRKVQDQALFLHLMNAAPYVEVKETVRDNDDAEATLLTIFPSLQVAQGLNPL